MKTGDYTKVFTHKEENPCGHRDTMKEHLHEMKHAQAKDHIHDHKLSMNREQVMDMHERERNRVHVHK